MNTALQRYLSSGVLMVWGMLLAWFYFSGRVSSYLHPAFHIGIAVSGVVLILLAAGRLFLQGGADCCEEDCSHAKAPWKQILAAVVLVGPLMVAAVVSPSQYSAAAVMNRGLVDNAAALPGYNKPYAEPPLPTQDGSTPAPDASQQTSPYLPTNAAGQIQAQTVDLVYAAEEPTMREDFENKEVELIGQFMPARSNNATGDRFNLVRMFIICCAADARPVAVTVQAPQPEKLAEMSWVKVTGKATFPVEGGRRVPVVMGSSVTPCDPPEETFVY